MAELDSLSLGIKVNSKSADDALDKLIGSLEKLNTSLSTVNSRGLQNFASGIQSISNASKGINTRGLNRLRESLSKLNSEAGNLSNTNFEKIGSSIAQMTNALSGAPNVSRSSISLVNAIARLGNAGNGIQNATTYMPKLSAALSSMIATMSSAPSVDGGTSSIVNSISRIANAGSKAKTTADSLDLLSKKTLNFISALSHAPNVSGNTTSLMASISNLANAGSKANSVFSRISSGSRNAVNGVSRLGNSFKNLTSKVNLFNASGKSFAQTAGMFYAKFFILIRGFKGLGNAIKSATGYIEEYNYFNTTFDKIAKESKQDFAKYGYENADDYSESFQKRLKEKLRKMTGFNIGKNGVLKSTNAKNLGLDITELTNYSAGIAQLSDSIGLSGEQSVITSQALTMLAGDMSSFKNLDMQQVMDNFSSGLAGSTMALRKYGIDISVASLKQTALNLGITKNVTTMSQAEKVQLRTLTILNQSRVAWGDLAKTIESPSNQIRMFQNNLKTLSRQLGEIFLPALTKVMPYVNAFAIVLQRLLTYIGSFIGLDIGKIIADSSDGFSDLDTGVDDVADDMDNATKSAKKLKNQLMGFDSLNIITTQSDSGKEGKDTSQIDLTEQLKDAFSDYEKVWNKEYKKMQNKAQKFADKMTETFNDAWKSGNGSDIGSAIADWLNRGLSWVNNNGNVFDKGIKKIANILATSINGFVKKFDFQGFGKVVGDRLKALLEARNDFFKNTDWKKLGEGIATSLNGFVDSGSIQEYLKGFGTKLRSAIEFAFGTITTFDFVGLGDALSQGINDALDEMSAIDMKTGLTGWEMLGQTISDAIIGLEDTVITFLDNVHWDEVGMAIADFIGNIDFIKVFSKLTDIGEKLAKGLDEAIKKGTKGYLELSDVVIAFAGLKLAKGSKQLFKERVTRKLGNIAVAITVAIEGFSFGKKIGTWVSNLINSDDPTLYLDVVPDFSDYSIEEWIKGFEDFSNNSNIGKVIDVASDILDALVPIKSLLETIGNFSENPWYENIYNILKTFSAPLKLLEDVTKWVSKIAEWIADFFGFEERWNEAMAGYTSEEATNIGFTGVEDLKKSLDKYGITLSQANEIFKNYYKGSKQDIAGMLIGDTEKAWEAVSKYKTKNKGVSPISYNMPDLTANVYTKLKLKEDEKKAFREKIATWSQEKLNAYSGLKIQKDALQAYKDAIKNGMKDYAVDIKAKANIEITARNAKEKGNTSFTITDDKGSQHTIYLANGGILKGGSWKDITRYADGGFPNMGQMFIARESGPELVGKIGNNTAVLNNDQIVSSVADGVAEAVASTLTPLITGGNYGGGDIVIQIDGETVFRAVRKQNDSFRKRNGGQSALA